LQAGDCDDKNPLLRLETFGQSIWLDFLRRGMKTSPGFLEIAAGTPVDLGS